MKTVGHIISAILTIGSIITAISQCSKDKEIDKASRFAEEQHLIIQKRSDIFKYPPNSSDSVQWMQSHAISFAITLDSCIRYYRSHYQSDENRYDEYLKWLYEYKKLGYLDQDWINYNKKITAKEKEGPAFLEKWKAYRNKTMAISMQFGATRRELEAFQEMMRDRAKKAQDSQK